MMFYYTLRDKKINDLDKYCRYISQMYEIIGLEIYKFMTKNNPIVFVHHHRSAEDENLDHELSKISLGTL